MIDKASYMAASVFPSKLLKTNIIKEDKIIPYHIQLYPTNTCNMSCPFCSCSEVDRKQSLTLEQCISVLNDAVELGAKAVTISGGGEPLLHSDIDTIVKHAYGVGMKIGLVSNGLIINKPDKDFWDCITWCRISSGDHRSFPMTYQNILSEAVSKGPNVDWAFSHVLSNIPNLDTIISLIDYANNNNFTHVRLVDDILDQVPNKSLDSVREFINNFKIDDSIVIYQGRKEFTKGVKDCYVSLLRPVIGADGYIYPCCGAQYSIKGEERGLNAKYSMGRIEDFKEIFSSQKMFDGSICYKCYYQNYNDSLKIIKSDLKHMEFV